MKCREELKILKQPYPRTCADCGLGPCKYHPRTDVAAKVHLGANDVTYEHIGDAEAVLIRARHRYLMQHGWHPTSMTPGRFAVWRRDFSDVDRVRYQWYEVHRNLSNFEPYGIVMATTEVAVQMTRAELDRQTDGKEDRP